MTKTLQRRPSAPYRLAILITACGSALLLSACGYRPLAAFTGQNGAPEAVRVPPGNQPVLQARGTGTLLYECQAIRRSPHEYQWLIRNSAIELTDSGGRTIRHRPGPRASWTHSDGSSAVAKESVEVPNGKENMPLERFRVEQAEAPGALSHITYVQRLHTVGGWVASTPCSGPQLGMQKAVPYEADYVFWRSAGS